MYSYFNTMSGTLFNTYSVKGNLKFYKNENNDEKITIGISITANHQVDENIYENLNEFLEKLLIADYISEDAYNIKKEHEKMVKKLEKDQVKFQKEVEKKKKKATKMVKKVKSAY